MTDPSEPPNIKFLRRLVTVLTATMIFGLLVVIGLLVIRFSNKSPDLPASITLPDGEKAVTFTQGPDFDDADDDDAGDDDDNDDADDADAEDADADADDDDDDDDVTTT